VVRWSLACHSTDQPEPSEGRVPRRLGIFDAIWERLETVGRE
jgi:hypothetical protein